MNTLINNRMGGLDSLWDNFFSYDEDASAYFCRENQDEYRYEIGLAGYKKENISIEIENNILCVKAEQDDKKFHRMYTVPKKSNLSSAVGSYKDGLLTVAISKKESAKPIKVSIS